MPKFAFSKTVDVDRDLIFQINTDFQNIDSVLNVDRTLWAFAVNQVILNLDFFANYQSLLKIKVKKNSFPW